MLLCFAVSGAGASVTITGSGSWYQTLQKPSWNPPGWVFGPVWTALYAMMAVAAWLVWRKAGFAGAPAALGMFFVQLALNLAWSFLFFGQQNPLAGLVDIALLWVAILVTIILFWPVSRAAAYLMIPYLLWVTYASTINFAIWRMN